jgi:hypothetical protein
MTETERGFRRIFWGLLFTVFDFHINGFDLLPDVVGFLLIALGLGLLAPQSLRFHTARIMAWFLFVLWFASLFSLVEGANEGGPFGGWFYFGVVRDVIDVTMVWQLCGGIIELARERGHEDLALRANTRRALYLALTLAAYFLSFAVLPGNPEFAVVAVIGLLVFAIVVMILLMALMLRAARELGDPAYEEYEPYDEYEDDVTR